MDKFKNLGQIRKDWLRYRSNIPIRFEGREFEDITNDIGQEIPKAILNWMDMIFDGEVIKSPGNLGSTGVGLLFDGPPGRGKTTLGCTILNEIVYRMPNDHEAIAQVFGYKPGTIFTEKFRPVQYITAPSLITLHKDLMDNHRDDFAVLQDRLDGIYGRSPLQESNACILLIDDLGKEYETEYTESILDVVIRSRYDAGLPTIITTNVLQKDFTQKFTPPMASFLHEAFMCISLGGKDLRARK